MNIPTIAVVGYGSWATALVKIFSEGNVNINWWIRKDDDIQHLLRFQRNPRYLSTVVFDLKKILPTADLKVAIKNADYIVIATPSAFLQDALSTLAPADFVGKQVISSVKGMIPDQHCTVAEYISRTFNVSSDQTAVIAGPCHAEEVAMERQSYLTVSSTNLELAAKVSDLVSCRYIHSGISSDIYGIEYCAVLKNIFAIACGIAKGLNYGDNYQAVLVSNATQEAKRFLDAAYPLEKRDLNASAYLGDILVTTYSQFSRNRTLGNMIGRGYSVKSAQIEMGMVAEGYYAAKSIQQKKQHFHIDMPVTEAVYNVLYEKISPIVEFQLLSKRLS